MNLFRFNMQNAIRAGLGVMIVFMFSYLFGSATFINWGHYCPVKILDLEINRVDHHPLGR